MRYSLFNYFSSLINVTLDGETIIFLWELLMPWDSCDVAVKGKFHH